MTEPLLDADAYVKQAGTQCPACGLDNLRYGSIDFDEASLAQKVSCQDCDAVWFDCYSLTGYEDLSVPDAPKEGCP